MTAQQFAQKKAEIKSFRATLAAVVVFLVIAVVSTLIAGGI